MKRIIRIILEIVKINFFALFKIKTSSLSVKEFPLDIYGKSAFFNHPFYKKGETSYFAQIYGSNNSLDFVVAKRSHLKFVSEIVKGTYVNCVHKLHIKEGELLPVSIPNKNTDASTASIRINSNGKDYELKKLKQNSFHFIPFTKESNVEVSSNRKIIVGDPIRFINSSSNKPNKKLVMSIFIDGLSSEIFKNEKIEKLMPNVAKYFSEGSMFFNVISSGNWTLPGVGSLFSGLYPIKHGMNHPRKELEIGKDYKIISEYFKESGYTTAQICSNFRKSPGYGYMKGFDRTLYKNGMNCKESIFNTIEHLRSFSKTSNYVWLTLFDLHDFLDGVPDLSVQTDLSIDLHNYGVDSSKSVFHSYDSNRIDRYLSELKRIDFYLKFLFDYISNNYQDEEIVLSICSDHGQSYLTDEEEILSRGRVVVPMFFKSEEAPFLTNNELVSNVDYLPSILNLSKINFEHDSIDGELPTIFGGKNGREYAISESIYPDQPYKAVIHKHNELFYVKSISNISNIDNIDIEKLELKLDKCLISDDGSIQYTKPDKDDLSKCIDMLIKR